MQSAEPLSGIVRSVLCVSRLGEADLRGWWATQSFGAAGRVVLKQRLPRTWRMAAVELDIIAAKNRHDEIIDRSNAVHLFSDNWPVRRWASAWVAEQKTSDPADALFEELETVTEERLVADLSTRSVSVDISGQAVRVGTVRPADFESAAALAPIVQQLASTYAEMGSFVVPYLEVSG